MDFEWARRCLLKLIGAFVGIAWAISCGPFGLAQAQPVTSLEQNCYDSVQGRVPWNRGGTREWVPQNVRNLCQGTINPADTISCFSAGIQRHGDWARAIDECKQQFVDQTSASVNSSGVSGLNVAIVSFAGGGQRLGRFLQIGATRQWVETGTTGGARFRFEEVRRDANSVLLVDRSRNVNIEFDLAAGKARVTGR